jgi:hypothetical protein
MQLDLLLSKIDSVTKGRVYLKPGERGPEGTQEFQGRRGGRFYEAQQQQVGSTGEVQHISYADLDPGTTEYLDEQRRVWEHQPMFSSQCKDARKLLNTAYWSTRDEELRDSQLKMLQSERGIENILQYRPDKHENGYVIDILASSPLNQKGSPQRRPGGANKLLAEVFREALVNNKDFVVLHPLTDAVPYYKQIGFEAINSNTMNISKEGMQSFLSKMQKQAEEDIEPMAVPEGWEKNE